MASRSERYRNMEAMLREQAAAEPDPARRGKLLAQADAWHRLARARDDVSAKQAGIDEQLARLTRAQDGAPETASGEADEE